MFSLIITAIFVLTMPLINYLETSKLKTSHSEKGKEKLYVKIYLLYILFTSLFLTQVSSFHELYNPKYTLTFNTLSHVLIWILIGYLVITNLLPLLILPFNQQLREKVAENYDDKLYPVTPKQQLMFVGVAIVVGICEEIIFRGFLYNYLQDDWGVSALWSFMIISVLFGAGHFMQGISGVISSTIFGLIMGYLYFVTGSLLVPIILHILYDAKSIWLTRVIQRHRSVERL